MNARRRVIGLAEAAAALRIPYQDAHRLLLTGQLTGEKRGGRWYVAIESLKHLESEGALSQESASRATAAKDEKGE